LGRTGVSVPDSEAVNVTIVFNADGLAGDGITVNAGVSAIIVCVNGPAFDPE
jgi:hypothetical protein